MENELKEQIVELKDIIDTNNYILNHILESIKTSDIDTETLLKTVDSRIELLVKSNINKVKEL